MRRPVEPHLKHLPGIRYPTPFEFHFGTEQQIRRHGLPHEPELTDPDLATHFTVTRSRGLCIYGKPIAEIFADVPRKDYLASIALDSEESFEEILKRAGGERCIVPQYAVLNFCRVLAYIGDGLVASKIEGAQWVLQNLPQEYAQIVSAALQEYRAPGSSAKMNLTQLISFVIHAQIEIRNIAGRSALNNATI